MKCAWLFVLFPVLMAQPCGAQDRALARAVVDIDSISLGDRLTLTVEVEHEPGQLVAWPASDETLGSFELLGTVLGPASVPQGRQTSSMRYTLTSFELGELEIPAIELAVADSGDSEPQLIRTEPIRVVVASVGLDGSGDIRAIKAPLDMPRNWLLLLPWVLLVGGLLALGYWLYRRYRGRERTTVACLETPKPARPPYEVAYEALERLEAKRLPERGEIKQYFIEVSEIIRTYLEGRYPIDALEMTSCEVLTALEQMGLKSAVYDLFPPFFERADLVKFAKHRPDLEACRAMIPMARRLVDETRMADRPPASLEGGDAGDGIAPAAAQGRVGVG